MEHVFKMQTTHLGSSNLKEDLVNSMAGIRACRDYGKGICEQFD